MITLSEAFKLCQIGNDEPVLLRVMENTKTYDHCLWSSEVRDRFDLEKIKVKCIRANFDRIKFIVVGISEDELRGHGRCG